MTIEDLPVVPDLLDHLIGEVGGKTQSGIERREVALSVVELTTEELDDVRIIRVQEVVDVL